MDWISSIYIGYFLLGIACFMVMRPPVAVATVYVISMLALPVTSYASIPGAVAEMADFSPYWVMPTALPADHWINRASVAGLTCFCGALLVDRKTVTRWRPTMIDLPIIGFCLWPLIQSLFHSADPPGWLASLTLVASWGLPWLLGRCYYADHDSRLALITIITRLTALLLPIALWEGITGQRVYTMIYGTHPFAEVGMDRVWGYRPLAIFEDGNQYALWISCMAVLACALAVRKSLDSGRLLAIATATALFAMTLLSQSVGAILLLTCGLAAIFFHSQAWRVRKLGIALALVAFVGMAVHLSGVVPIRTIAKETVAGQTIVRALESVGQTSFTWRVSQDEQVIPEIQAQIITGTGQWDWWRQLERRPWGFPLLLIGQFGLIGCCLALASPAWAVIRPMRSVQTPPSSTKRKDATTGYVLSVVLVMAFADSLLNAFILLPCLIFAGGLAAPRFADQFPGQEESKTV